MEKTKKMMNLPGSQYDGQFFTKEEGEEIIMAVAMINKWNSNVMMLEIQSWIDRF